MLKPLIAAILLVIALPITAEEVERRQAPGAEAMVYDAIFMRPLTLLGTAIGTAAFIGTLPISIVGGNVGDAAESFVMQPARSTFTRCLGCSSPAGTPSGM
ncbi:MAG: hypothetical protein ACPHUF_06195 [Gammaproteobacteria bacterium]|tara:strand:- start:792 stop:1094 length:303 start_codon:yes stop_codon:yes gene_type:complete